MRPISPPAEKRIELVGYQREGGNVIPEFAIGYAQQPRGHPILQSPALIAFRRRDRRCGRTKRRGKPSWRSSREEERWPYASRTPDQACLDASDTAGSTSPGTAAKPRADP